MTLRTENLTVCYGTNKILDGVSLALPAGKTTALLGPNGCGKSTLLNCFSRLLAPQSGGVFLGDNAINTLSSRQLARRLALLPQHHLTPEGITVQSLFRTVATRGCHSGGVSPLKTMRGSKMLCTRPGSNILPTDD